MVTLYLPFKNEAVETLDRNGFLRMYDEREAEIMAKHTSNSRDDFVRNVLGPEGTENNDDFDNALNTIGISAVRKRSNVMSKQEYCHMMRSTNSGQRKLILETIHRLHLSDSIPIQIFFTGPAGSGKTYVLKLLMETYNRYTQQHNSLRNAFVACASTGKAAVNLGGVTVHSAFKITQSRRIGTMAREVLKNYRSTFIGVKCIIIDEVIMIGCDVLHKINLLLKEITGVHDQPFGNLNIIFCGDLHQLPPVNASPVYKGPRNSICGPVLWQSLDYYPLEQVMRQSDSTFSGILTKIGNGERLGTEQIALIESHFRSRAWCNYDVDAYNNNAFIPDFENIANDKMIGYNTLTEVATARRNLHKMSVVESGGLPYSLKLAVGYPYMITMNLDVEDGLVNGAIGTLKYIEYLTEDEQVTIYGTTEVAVEPQPSTSTRIRKRVRLWLEFPNPSMGQLCRVKAKLHVMCKRDVLDLKWTPIVTRAANIPLGGNIKCRRNQFPVVSANAITIHKSQGGTFDEVVFNYDKSQQIQLVYVALSRVILIVSAFNAQSLVAHAGDIESDNILMNSDYMVISETWG
ncbi:hypothetical protein TNCV_5061581 [Trichonephila clavipes]|nr:hypothetical protein TNCV_5061581 [Trichonephila clavipes]